VAVERGTESQAGVLKGEGARQRLFIVDGHAPDQLTLVELLRNAAEQHARTDPYQQGQIAGQPPLSQRVQPGQQHVLVHLQQLWRGVG
jgi:hypothetical protein